MWRDYRASCAGVPRQFRPAQGAVHRASAIT
jgi:hypothetical protein